MSDVPETIEVAVAEAKRYIDELCGRAPLIHAQAPPPYTVAISMAKTTAYRISDIALCYNLSEADRNILLVAQLAKQLEHLQDSYMDVLNRTPTSFIVDDKGVRQK